MSEWGKVTPHIPCPIQPGQRPHHDGQTVGALLAAPGNTSAEGIFPPGQFNQFSVWIHD